MKGYMVLKPLELKGKRRMIGEKVSSDTVVQSQAARLVRMGYLAESIEEEGDRVSLPCENNKEPLFVILPFKQKGETTKTLSLNPGEVQAVFEIIQMDAKSAAEAVAMISKYDVLEAINICDSRKGVREAISKQETQIKENPDSQMEDN